VVPIVRSTVKLSPVSASAKQQLHAENQHQVSLIEFFGLGWTVVNQYDMDEIDPERRIQVRDSNHYNPSAPVKWLVQQMSHKVLPFPIVTQDRFVADGNTRFKARKIRRERFTPVIVIDARYEDSPPEIQAKLEVLAAAFNGEHGTALTSAERVRAASTAFHSLNLAPEHYSAMLGLKPSDVTAINQEAAARARLEKLNIDTGDSKNGGLSAPALRALGRQACLNLNNQPYTALANLAQEAGLTTAEITQLATEAKETGSDQQAFAFLTTQREEMADRIVQKRLTGEGHPAASGQLRRALGYARKFQGNEAQLIETNPAAMAEHIAVLTEVRDLLSRVLELQAEYQPTLEEAA